MRIKHIRSGQEKTVTKEKWDVIVQNGFASDFKILPDVKPAEEVIKALKGKSSESEQ